MPRGRYIVFEGIDGAGKSTLIHKLQAHLSERGEDVVTTAEPTNNPVGSMIRHVLNGRIRMSEQTIAALFLADRLDHLQNETNGIIQDVEKGKTVIGDRYYLSSYAYHVPHVSLEYVIEANRLCAEMLRPDFTFFIDISVDESLRRISANRQSVDLFENRERISLVRKNYVAAIERVKNEENIVVIDGERNIEAVFADICAHL